MGEGRLWERLRIYSGKLFIAIKTLFNGIYDFLFPIKLIYHINVRKSKDTSNQIAYKI